MATEAELQHLYQQLQQALDREGATTMIELLGPYARHEPATKADLDVFAHSLRAEMAELRGELRTEMAGLRTEMAQMEQRLGQRLTTTFVRTQGVTVAVLGLLVALT